MLSILISEINFVIRSSILCTNAALRKEIEIANGLANNNLNWKWEMDQCELETSWTSIRKDVML